MVQVESHTSAFFEFEMSPLPVTETLMVYGASLNVAVTVRAVLIVSEHVLDPLHAPDQPVKT
jgi:hypothetical protein